MKHYNILQGDSPNICPLFILKTHLFKLKFLEFISKYKNYHIFSTIRIILYHLRRAFCNEADFFSSNENHIFTLNVLSDDVLKMLTHLNQSLTK